MSEPLQQKSKPTSDPMDRKILIVVAVVLWGLAVAFAVMPTRNPIPLPEPVVVSAADIDPSPRFQPMGDDAKALVSLFYRTCMECHNSLVDSSNLSRDRKKYHDNVQLNHGLNARCVNCHDQQDRNRLVLRDGETVPYSQSSTLCSNCHGPAYRQWQRGVHGKTLGYWDARQGPPNRLQCVECHDPHSPHYNPMAPLPAPNTLRMGNQDPEGTGAHGGAHSASPLMRAQKLHKEQDAHKQKDGQSH